MPVGSTQNLSEAFMRSTRSFIAATLVAVSAAACSSVNRQASEPGSVAVTDAGPQQTIQWGPAPAVFPPGAQLAVMQGDPSKAEPFTVRLKFPNGYKIPPHTHPTEENVTVLSGTFLAGMGAQLNESNVQANGRGDFLSIPANHAHYAIARGETIVQVNAIGPFTLTYVNPDGTPVSR
jgi:quercetin dioxygenase-like cupin family protein